VRVLVGLVVAVLLPWTAAGPAAAGDGPTRTNKVVETRVIGHSVAGRPIVAYRKGAEDAPRSVVVLGQMHGDEPAGVATARWLKDHVAVREDVTVWVVPTMNPDGLARGTRTNAHRVDLNRNWPMNWRRTSHGLTYSGRRPASEPETRAVLAFLREVQPDYVASIHQPYGEVGFYADKPRPFQRRLAHYLHLPLRGIDIGGPTPPPAPDPEGVLQPGGSDNAPTMTGWFNAHYPGTAMTVEFRAHPTRRYVRAAAKALLRAALAY
jgi:murein tripeptide amidase MpaA